MTQPVANLEASIRARLLNIAHARNEEFQAVLTRYGVERLLYRLATSTARDRFVLKGAALIYAWEGNLHRPTRDVDFLGFGDPTLDALVEAFRAIVLTQVEPDGLIFLDDSMRAAPIREENEYGGLRITMIAMLGNARIPLQVDVGFGDAVTPEIERVTFPTLLDLPAPVLNAYPAESVIAEKYQAMVALGIANGRMKDFYDVYCLNETHMFDGTTLTAAIAATFERRRTNLPTTPAIALTQEFANDPAKRTQWAAFLNRNRLTDAPPDLSTIITAIAAFLAPVSDAARAGTTFTSVWLPGTGWTPS